MLLSYCVVNTNGREYLLACLDAIARNHPPGTDHEVLVLDNASDDGSADSVRERHPEVRLIVRDTRAGKAENDTALLRDARGRFCLLLNEDSEIEPGAPTALLAALEADPGGRCSRGAADHGRGRAEGVRVAASGSGDRARHGALPAPAARRAKPRPGGPGGWMGAVVGDAGPRGGRREVDYLDPDFFVYSDETDFCKRLHDARWRILFAPGARAIHHDQLSTDPVARTRRAVEFHRNRDLYMRKHHSRVAAAAVRALTAWFYLVRAAAAPLLRGDDARWYLLHARQALRPGRGDGIREAAETFNERLQASRR